MGQGAGGSGNGGCNYNVEQIFGSYLIEKAWTDTR